MSNPVPTKAQIFELAQAQSESVTEISERLVKIEKLADTQEARNKNIIIAVLIAFVAIVASVAVQVSVSDKRDRSGMNNAVEKIHAAEIENIRLQSRIEALESRNLDLQKNFDLIKTRNPYLK